MTYYLQIRNNEILSNSTIPVSDADIQNMEVSETIYNDYSANPDKYYYDNGEIKAKTEQEQKQEILAEQFFNTSLGYVRRKVTMKDGTIRDFLSDVLPLLQTGVPVLTYTANLEQNRVLVTEQFINECKQQMLQDFYGVA
jgi:hypothetical protein